LKMPNCAVSPDLFHKQIKIKTTDLFDTVTFVETIYFNTHMCKFESSQMHISGAYAVNFTEVAACRKPAGSNCQQICIT